MSFPWDNGEILNRNPEYPLWQGEFRLTGISVTAHTWAVMASTWTPKIIELHGWSGLSQKAFALLRQRSENIGTRATELGKNTICALKRCQIRRWLQSFLRNFLRTDLWKRCALKHCDTCFYSKSFTQSKIWAMKITQINSESRYWRSCLAYWLRECSFPLCVVQSVNNVQ